MFRARRKLVVRYLNANTMNCPNCKSKILPSDFSIFSAMKREYRCGNCKILFLVNIPKSFQLSPFFLPVIFILIISIASFYFEILQFGSFTGFIDFVFAYILSIIYFRFILSKKYISKMQLKEWDFH